jgi:hypothetical protein
MPGKPTPTQAELDRSALGEYILEHEDDGSGPDPNVVSTKQLEAEKPAAKPATYQTRAATPKSSE